VKKVMLICGEPSGDQLGGQLMRGLKTLAPGIGITGVGGPAMAAEGLESLFSLDATAVMGLREVLPAIPRILKRVRQATDCALATRPDAVVLIDSPDFTHRIAHAIKKRDPSLRTVNYVAPQVWAWKEHRVKHFPGLWDRLLCLLPFEPAFFARHNLPATFVGSDGFLLAEYATDMANSAEGLTEMGDSMDAQDWNGSAAAHPSQP
jgi:lipid-A-disaccharide synthase